MGRSAAVLAFEDVWDACFNSDFAERGWFQQPQVEMSEMTCHVIAYFTASMSQRLLHNCYGHGTASTIAQFVSAGQH